MHKSYVRKQLNLMVTWKSTLLYLVDCLIRYDTFGDFLTTAASDSRLYILSGTVSRNFAQVLGHTSTHLNLFELIIQI